jgi:gluconate kinase
MRPRVVVVTGAPGSGKSTLARLLSTSLRVPMIARDDIRGGLLFSAGAWSTDLDRIPSADEAVDVFLDLVEELLRRDVSCVAEYVFRTARPDQLERILAAGDVLIVQTNCDDAMSRFIQRNLSDLLISQPAVLGALGYDSVDSHTADAVERMNQVEREMLVDLPVPMLRVDTNDGYEPPLTEILEFVTASGATTGNPES